jgi:methionyl-tRNA synthetase
MAVYNKSLASNADVSFDHFIRTTDDAHKDTVRHVWVCLRWSRGFKSWHTKGGI